MERFGKRLTIKIPARITGVWKLWQEVTVSLLRIYQQNDISIYYKNVS
jgi:hypothetical protein